MTKFLLFMIFSFLITSCGDLKKSDVNRANPIFGSDCKFEPETFSNLLKEDISEQIDCLNKKMERFLEVVQTDRPGFLSRKTLTEFIEGGVSGIDLEVLPIIDSVFDLSFLIFGDSKDYISRNNLNRLTEFLKFFNRNVIRVYSLFKSKDRLDYKKHTREADIVQARIKEISQELNRLFVKDRQNDINFIDIDKLITNFFSKNPESADDIRSYLFLKRIFLGGEMYRLTNVELQDALDEKLFKIGRIAYDITKSKHFTFSHQKSEMLDLYAVHVGTFKSLLHFGPDEDKVIFSLEDIYHIANRFINKDDNKVDDGYAKEDPIDLSKYAEELLAFKAPFMGEESDGGESRSEITSTQLHRLVDHIAHLVFKAQSFYRIYARNEALMNTPHPRSQDIRYGHDKEMLADFVRIVKNYRFLKGSFRAPYYDYKYQRNPDAIIEVSLIEYAVSAIMAYYGHEKTEQQLVNENYERGMYYFSSHPDLAKDDSYLFLKKIQNVLVDLGVLKRGRTYGHEIMGTRETVVLMSTLFQYQSNGCEANGVCLEVPELTEFLIGMLTSFSLKDIFIEGMEEFCPYINEPIIYKKDRRFTVACFRENFPKVLARKIPGSNSSLASYLPELNRYVTGLVKNEAPLHSKDYLKFLLETEAFTRVCNYANGEELPLKANDAFSVFAGLLNIESTFLRFDANENGIMDGTKKKSSEVLKAYFDVYEGAVKSLAAKESALAARIPKWIYLYLIKYGEVPKVDFNFLKFIVKLKKGSNATRTTIASILKTLGESSPTRSCNPFQCDKCLGDPNVKCDERDREIPSQSRLAACPQLGLEQ